MAQDRFYVVLKRTDDRLFRHNNLKSAEQEACRLANKCYDAFFVLPVLEGYKAYSVPVKFKENFFKRTLRKTLLSLLNLLD